MITVSVMPVYLSRILLNPRSHHVMRELANPYEMHRTLMKAFPKASADRQSNARHEFGVLFRPEFDVLQNTVKIYVQSQIEPEWSALHNLNDYLYPNTNTCGYEYKNIMPFLQKIQNGQVLSFRIRANPTKRIAKNDDSMKGKRIELKHEEEQIQWLIRKGQTNSDGSCGGFDLIMRQIIEENGNIRFVPCVKVYREGKQIGYKKDTVYRHRITQLAVLYEGLLRVTDANAFLKTIVKGIGCGKAFGFGLLSVAPSFVSVMECAT